MFRLALRTLRFRKGSFLASFIALFFGAAIVMACGGLMETGIRLAIPPERLAAAPILLSSRQTTEERSRLDAATLAKISSVEGIAKAIPDVSFPAYVLHNSEAIGDAESFGHGWSSAALAPYTLVEGDQPTKANEIVIDQKTADQVGAKPGETVTVAVRGDAEEFLVSGIAVNAQVKDGGLFFTDAKAQQLFGQPGKYDVIGIFPEPGTDEAALKHRIDEAVHDKQILALRGDDRGEAELSGATTAKVSLIVIGAVFGGFVAMVAVFVAGSTLSLLIQQRQREMALLKAVGATPGQLRRMILGETMVVALLATTLATVPGFYIGQFLLERLASAGVVPATLVFKEGWIPMAAAILLSLITAALAALVASQGAVRVRPTEALTEAGLQKRWFNWIKLVFVLLCLGGGIALGLVTMLVMAGPVAASTAGPSSILWAVALALLAPGLTGVLFFVLRGPVRLSTGLSGYMATLNARTRKIRMAAAIVPIMLSTGIATSMIYQQTTQSETAFKMFTKDLRVDAVLISSTGGFAPDFAATVSDQAGVMAASALISSSGYFVHPDKFDEDGENSGGVEDDAVALQGVTAEGATDIYATPIVEGSLHGLRDSTVALPTTYAERLGVKVGNGVKFQFGDGAQAELKVVALFTTTKGFETVFVPAELLAQHTTDGLVPQILVRASPGVDQSSLTATLNSLAGTQPGLRVTDRQGLDKSFAEQEQTGAWINYLLSGMIIGYTIISLVNTLVVATAERKREFATQRLIGSTRAQIMRMIAVEAVLIAVCGIILGAVVAALTLVPFSIALNGSAWPLGPAWIYLSIIGFATLLTLTATLLPTWWALRTRPIEAAAIRE